MPRVLVNAFTSKGNLYQVPEGWQTMAIFYNPKIFQAAGLAEPAEDWTWDDFLATAVKLTSGQVMGFGMPWGFFQLHPWWLSNNASAVTPDGTQPSLSSPAFVESVQFLTDLVLKYKVTPDPTTTVDVYSEFSAGRFAMIATGRYSLLGWEQAGFNDYKAVKWPKKVSHRTVIGGGGWAISAKAGDKTLAWEAIEALMTEQTVHGLAELGEQVPIYPEADVDPANGAQRAAQRYIDTLLPDCVPVAAPTFYDELQTVAMSQLQAIVTGQASPAAGLAAADQEIKANL
jgi:multiple sugar transport system substrate-binding protein